MCVIFLIDSDPSSNMNKKLIRMLGNDEADVNNEMSRKYKEKSGPI